MKRIGVVVPSWNTRELLAACLAALQRSRDVELDVVVVDNASADGSAELVAARFPGVRLLRNATNLGFTRACNQGLARVGGEFVLLLNSDARVEPDALARLAGFLAEHADYAAAAPRLVDARGRTQATLMRFPGWRTPLAFGTPLERLAPDSAELRRYFARDLDLERDADVEQPPAACLLLRRAALDAVGALDESLWLYFSDVDLSLRLARAGWKTRYLASAVAAHDVGASTRAHPERLLLWHRDRLRYYRKHFGLVAGLWVKACVLLASADFVARETWSALRSRPREPLAPVLRSLRALLTS